MQTTTPRGQKERHLRLYTVDSVVEGKLNVSEMLRTLDDLNIVTKTFVHLQDANCNATNWSFARGAVSINRNSILFVLEMGDPPARKVQRQQFGFTRACAKLRLGRFDVEGFVHVPPGGTPMSRINQDNHPFMAITSASVSCGNLQFAAPFLAINRSHIDAAQELYTPEESSEESAKSERAPALR